jgi:N,N'-diacetyllegionaminate synthase
MNSVKIIAEIAQSYEGSSITLIELIKKLCETKVDMIMYQVVLADELATKENDAYSFFRSIELPENILFDSIEVIHGKKKKAVAEVFGIESAEKMVRYGVDAIKVHPADVSNIPFLRSLSELETPIYLGVGGCSEGEITNAIEAIRWQGSFNVTLLHGYQTGPTPIEDANFTKIRQLKKRFSIDVGYSDHSSGSINGDINMPDPIGLYSSVMALSYGASTIEKHVMPDRSKKWEDYESAITPDELDQFIKYANRLENSLGSSKLGFNLSEKQYRKSSKKYIVAAQNLKAGQIINLENLEFKRIKNPDIGIINSSEIQGKILIKNIQKNQPITLEALQ